jgi:hypothetical protein
MMLREWAALNGDKHRLRENSRLSLNRDVHEERSTPPYVSTTHSPRHYCRGHRRYTPPPPERLAHNARRGRGKRASAKFMVGLTDQTLSCAAEAHVATAARHAACLHLKRAMQTA